jgi:hypothetical protein
MAFVENQHYHLEELAGSDYEIVDEEPNIIDWKVKNESGVLIGEVANLLFDRQSGNVRYLVLDLSGNKLNLDKGRKVLVPIGVAEIYRKDNRKNKIAHDAADHSYYPEEDGNIVILPEVTAEHLNALPLYERDHLSKHIEMAIRNIFLRSDSEISSAPTEPYDAGADDFYRHKQFSNNKFYGSKKTDD